VTFLGVTGGTLIYLREAAGDKALVALNFSSSPQTVSVPVRQLLDDGTRLRDAIAGKVKARVKNGRTSLKLGALASAILLPE
jgi:hypothetical protein